MLVQVLRTTQSVRESTRARDKNKNRMIVVWVLELACGHVAHRSSNFDRGGGPPRSPKQAHCVRCGENEKTNG